MRKATSFSSSTGTCIFGMAARRTSRTSKNKIFGLNAARLYGIDVESQMRKIRDADVALAVTAE